MQQSRVNQDFTIDRLGFKFQLEFKLTDEVWWWEVISALSLQLLFSHLKNGRNKPCFVSCHRD